MVDNESLISKSKGLFLRGKTPHLPDPGLTGEANFSHCLYEIPNFWVQLISDFAKQNFKLAFD